MLTEEHMIEKLRDGLRQDLRQGLIALRFKSVRELIEAAQALEACIGESQGGHDVTILFDSFTHIYLMFCPCFINKIP
jgi:tryptophanase